MKEIGFLSTMLVAGCVVLSTGGADASWKPSPPKFGKGLYYGGAAIRDAKRNDPIDAIEKLLGIPGPTNPYPYLPKDQVIKSFRKVDPPQRYGPEFQDLFR